MINKKVYPAEMSTQTFGKLTINVATQVGLKPIEGAQVIVRKTGVDTPVIEQLATDGSGQTVTVELETPPFEASQEPSDQKPYGEYTVQVAAPQLNPVQVDAVQLLADQTAIQAIRMIPLAEISSQQAQPIVIDPHTLYAEYPPKIPEDEIKTEVDEPDWVVLPFVQVPETIVVHDGVPNDTSAPNYFVNFKEYIKNVASSEIYSTWPENTIIANILAVLSFTLNRVYTEWYRNKGYRFTITSSTAFDHKFIYGRNIYRNISEIVDTVFINYCSRPGIRQPLFTQYCDGQRVSCPTWMSVLQ